MTFGALLRSLRHAAGLTQEELARRAGLTANGVSALERGIRLRPYPHTVQVLADALGVSETDRQGLTIAATARPSTNTEMGHLGDLVQSRLARPPTALLGREAALQELVGLLLSHDQRLITLTGPGGVGKTRLALEAADRGRTAFRDGVAFAALAPLTEPSMIRSVIAAAVASTQGPAPPTGADLLYHLQGRELLLVMDNFEHLMEAAPDVANLISNHPTLTVLVTSRARLRLRAETEVAVQPLSLPVSTRNPTPEQVQTSAAGQLFLDRARAAQPGFAITSDTAASVAAICWRLGGLPLALELAASKVPVLPPKSLLERLDTALSAGWMRDLPTRQHTLRATLDWSYQLLDHDAQLLLAHLSVFAGGFTLEAAEALASPALDSGRVLSALEGLVEHSLVMTVTHPDGRAHYTMLEPIRQYARTVLNDSGQEQVVRRKHAAYFLAVAEAASPEHPRPGKVQTFDHPEWETDNYRAAMSWALSAGEADTAVRLGWALSLAWWMTGRLAEGRQWMESALALEMTAALRSRALQIRATMCYAQGDLTKAATAWNTALELARASGDGVAEACALAGTGLAAATTDPAFAEDRLRQSIALATRVGDQWLRFLATIWLGSILLLNADPAGARPAFERAMIAARERGDRLVAYVALFNFARASIALHDHQAAEGALQESIELSVQSSDRTNLAYALDLLAVVRGAREDWPAAAILMGASQTLRQTTAGPVYTFYLPDEDLRAQTLQRAEEALGSAGLNTALHDGQRMNLDEAARYAMSLTAGPITR